MSEQNSNIQTTAALLIEEFGDQAYQKSIQLARTAYKIGDREASRELAAANLELLKLGYHKRGLEKP